MKLPFVATEHTIVSGPEDVGVEQRWKVQLGDGREAVVAQLAPDLARDESIRRRYIRDLERLRELHAISLAPTLAIGPQPDPRDPKAVEPWRIRLDPRGQRLDAWLARAPVPLDEWSELFAGVADAVHAVHSAGAVLRDLGPEQIVRTQDGRTILTDVGLARVDVLSSHTASSLLLQGSRYIAPEQLFATAVDQRSDVYSLGAMMWQALTGEMPYGDDVPLLVRRDPLPSLRETRPDVPDAVDRLVRACLDPDPAKRPASVSEIAWVLRGGTASGDWGEPDLTHCQHCDARLRVGQRLCVHCGRLAVRFEHAPPGTRGWGLELVSLSEDAKPLKWLQDFLGTVSRPPFHKPDFIIGSVHLYDEAERVGRIRLPARLYSDLTRDTAESLHALMHEHGLKTRVVSPHDQRKSGIAALATIVATIAISFALAAIGIHAAFGAVPGGVLAAVMLGVFNNRMTDRKLRGRFQLRVAPAALPASDPFVARLAVIVAQKPPADVKDIVAELALLVQRLVDHRASLGGSTRELDVLTEPIEPLVTAVERQAKQLMTISEELAELDEGAMVRALAASEARADPATVREPILQGLDRLRALEDQRALVFHRLLEVKILLRRTVDLGLSVHDPVQEHERQVKLALATLQH
jgi:hypothetical protein